MSRVKITNSMNQLADFPLDEMKTGEIGIMTETSGAALVQPGDLVIAGFSEYVFPGTRTFVTTPNKYRARNLLPGEIITIREE